MKNLFIKLPGITLMAILGSAQIKAQGFKAEQVVQSASIVLDGNIEKVFPLFGAIEEKKWSEGWNPTPVFPASGNMEEGFIFQTADHVPGQPLLTWVVSKYSPASHQLQYIITSSLRVTTISVNCSKLSDSSTKAEITYKLAGLSDEGNLISHHLISKMFKHNLKDWETAINNYLTKKN
jgi:hypothetical protein